MMFSSIGAASAAESLAPPHGGRMEVHGGCMEVHGGCMEVHGGCIRP